MIFHFFNLALLVCVHWPHDRADSKDGACDLFHSAVSFSLHAFPLTRGASVLAKSKTHWPLSELPQPKSPRSGTNPGNIVARSLDLAALTCPFMALATAAG